MIGNRNSRPFAQPMILWVPATPGAGLAQPLRTGNCGLHRITRLGFTGIMADARKTNTLPCKLGALLLAVSLSLQGCSMLDRNSDRQPSSTNNVCRIFAERPHWYRATQASEARWGAPAWLQMAIIWRESGFPSKYSPAAFLPALDRPLGPAIEFPRLHTSGRRNMEVVHGFDRESRLGTR